MVRYTLGTVVLLVSLFFPALSFALNPPADFKITAVTTSQIDLQWKDSNSSQAQYVLERSLTADFLRAKKIKIKKGIFFRQDKKLKNNTRYYYRMRAAAKKTIPSAYSVVVQAVTGQPLPNPDPDPSPTSWGSGVTLQLMRGEHFSVAAGPAGGSFVTADFQGTIDFGNGTTLSAAGSNYQADVYVARYNSNGTLAWAKRFGDADQNVPAGIGADQNGNSYVAGRFVKTITFGSTELVNPLRNEPYFTTNIFLAKLDPAGNPVWAHNLGRHYPTSLAVNKHGELAIVGYAFDDQGKLALFLSKYRSDGSLVRKLILEYRQTLALKVAIDDNGTVAMAGDYILPSSGDRLQLCDGRNRTSAGFSDIFVQQFDSTLTQCQWANTFGGIGPDTVSGIAIDSLTHRVAIGGSMNNFTDASGTYRRTSITFDGGRTSHTADNNSVRNSFLAVFPTTGGNAEWSAGFRGHFNEIRGVAFNSSGDLLSFTDGSATGYSPASLHQTFVARFAGNSGQLLWNRGFYGSLGITPFSLASNADGDVFVTTYFVSTFIDPIFPNGQLFSSRGSNMLLKLAP